MPLFRWSCILGGRCMQIKEDEEIPEISGRRNNRICQSQRGLANVDDNEIEQAMLYMYRPCIGSISLGMMVCRPGILIHRDLVLTSHGNLPSFDAAIDSEFVICYLPSSHHRRGIPPKVVLTRRLEPQRYFLTSEVLDLTLVACERVPENISDIVPLSIHQHLGSMNFLEAGHQIYVVGHLNSNDKRGILVCGSAHTVVIPENDLCSNQLIAFTSDLKQDTTGKLWMTGSAGFDEKGEFSFMVVRPQFLYSMNATSDMPDGQFQRKSLENGSVCGIPQYGVPLYIIQDWMLAHGIRDLDNLPSPISSSMSAGFRRVMASLTGSKGIEDHPSNSHSSFTLRDGNSINYVVMDSGSIILEGQSWRNSSPPESFTSYEAAKLGNGSPLERFPTMQLESAMTSGGSRNGDSLNVKEMGCGTTAFVNQEESVVDECCYGPLPKRSVSVQDADLRLLRRSLSQILPSHPLRRRSRTLPSYLRTIDFPDEKQLHYGVTKPCASYLGPDHHEGLDNDKSHDMFSFECINPTPSPQKEYFSESNINDNHTQIRQAMEGDYGSNLSFMDVSSSEVYEEIPLQSQKSSALGESCNENRNNTVFTDNLSIEASNDRHSKDEQIPRSKQEYPSIDNLLFNAGSFEGSNQVTFLKERDKWKPSGKTSRVGHAGASYNNEIKVINERDKNSADEIKVINDVARHCDDGDMNTKITRDVTRVSSNDGKKLLGGSIIDETELSTCESSRSGNEIKASGCADEIYRDGITIDSAGESTKYDGISLISHSAAHAYNYFSIKLIGGDDVKADTIESEVYSREHNTFPSSKSVSSGYTTPLRPEEVSKRIQGYGNVSINMQQNKANIQKVKDQEKTEALASARHGSDGTGTPTTLRSLFGTSLLSGRWSKPGSNKVAPQSDEHPT